MNSVRLYSNGTAVIWRRYSLSGDDPLAITIPVRKSDLDDVVSSLGVFSEVTMASPPTYTPTNAEETELSLEPSQAMEAITTELAGCAVEIEAGSHYRGTIVGRQPHRETVDGLVTEEPCIILWSEKGIQQIPESAITALQFSDPAIQAEIDKALGTSRAAITPDRSQIDFAIRADNGATEAFVTYATPVAAWKIRYQLRLGSEGTELDGQAIVDNDTDDDWTATQITVTTGDPITFSTDLAELKRPWRRRLNLVAHKAAGAVVREPASMHPGEPSVSDDDDMVHGFAEVTRGGTASAMPASPPEAMRLRMTSRARQNLATTRRSGDFSSFTAADPVTIKAKRSAIVPLFRLAVAQADTLLYYNEQDDAERPFRAVRLKNEADYALGRGVCEVFRDGDFQGKAVLQSTPPGEEALLVHARDTGVEVDTTTHPIKTQRLATEISGGAVRLEQSQALRTDYLIRNRHDEAFAFECDHDRYWSDSTIAVEGTGCGKTEAEPEQLQRRDGVRFRFTLPARGMVTMMVREERIERESFALKLSWLRSDVIGKKKLERFSPEMRSCLEAGRRVDALEEEIKTQEKMAKTDAEEQTRLMKLIQHAHAEQAGAWRSDLAEAEERIRTINRQTIPDLKEQLKQAKRKLADALGDLAYSWRKDGETI